MRSGIVGLAAAGVLLAGPAVLAFFDGGFFDEPRLIAAIAACVLVALAALAAERPLPRHWPGRLALGGLLALTAWTALSLLWAPLGQPALDDLQRLVLYSAGLTAAAAWLSFGRERAAEPLLALGTVVVIGYGLSERVLPGVVDLASSARADGRLEQPITYWNGTGLVAAFGLVLCARLAGSRGRPAAIRAAAAAAAPILGAGLFLTLSRGALGAAAAGLLLLIVLAPEPSQLRGVGVTGATAALAGAVAAALPSLRSTEGASQAQGAALLAALVALCAAAALVQLRRARSEHGDDVAAPALARRARIALVALLGVLALATASGAATSSRKAEGDVSGSRGTSRLASIQSPRYRYWEVALDAFAAHPLRGVGSAGFAVEWLRDGDPRSPARDAHSLYLETAAELGLVGLALLAAFIAGVVASTRRALRVARTAAVGPAAALAAAAFHAAFDWDWELPAVTLPALAAAGLLVALGDQAGAEGRDERLRAAPSATSRASTQRAPIVRMRAASQLEGS